MKSLYYVTQEVFSASSPLYHLNVLGQTVDDPFLVFTQAWTTWTILLTSEFCEHKLKTQILRLIYSDVTLVWKFQLKFKQISTLSSFKSPEKLLVEWKGSGKPFPSQKENASMFPSIFISFLLSRNLFASQANSFSFPACIIFLHNASFFNVFHRRAFAVFNGIFCFRNTGWRRILPSLCSFLRHRL